MYTTQIVILKIHASDSSDSGHLVNSRDEYLKWWYYTTGSVAVFLLMLQNVRFIYTKRN